MRPGLELLEDAPGEGALVKPHGNYEVRLRMWLSRGDPVRWNASTVVHEGARIEDEGTNLYIQLRVDRESMFAGLRYGVDGMRVGGTRRLRVAPHLAYRDAGVPGVIPANAILVVEVEILTEREPAP